MKNHLVNYISEGYCFFVQTFCALLANRMIFFQNEEVKK